jgi:starch synthase
MLDENIQFVLLGTGEEKFHIMLREFKEKHSNAAILLKYDEKLAHKIYAASDMFLMPSRFEPCGLGQMIALKYGTVPIVRHTGGLADTITDYTKDHVKGNGFSFVEYTEDALEDAIRRALKVYNEDKEAWKKLQIRGMSQSFSWHDSAKKYENLYRKACGEAQKLQ